MRKWEATTLGKFVVLQRGHDLTESERRPGTIPVMGSAGRNGYHDTAMAKGPGIVIGRSGASFGQVHLSKIDYWPHNTCLYVTNFLGNDPYFAYYFLKGIDFSRYNSGSAQPSLNRNLIYPIDVCIPAVAEQRAIGRLLRSLDDKIELNRRMNETLEAMARALFKDWFIDFGPVRAKMEGRQPPGLSPEIAALFPDKLDEEGKPEGWAEATLDDVAALATQSTSPSRSPEALYEHYSIPAFDAGRTAVFELGRAIKSNKYLVHSDAVLVSKLNPETARVWLPIVHTHKAVCSTEFMQFIPRCSEDRPYLYLLMSSAPVQELILQRVTGSTGSRQRAQPSAISILPVILPEESIRRAFAEMAKPMLAQSTARLQESQSLAELRDLLLPQLLSGGLRIPDATNLVQEVA